MDVILHIGSGRTGTTSLQHFLDRSRESLLSRGYGYTSSLGERNNIEIAKYGLLNERNPFFKRNSVLTPADKSQFDSAVERKLAAEVEGFGRKGISSLIISSEHFATDLRRPEAIERVRSLFASTGLNVIKIIYYIREQVSYLYSDYSTRVVMGMAREYSPRIPEGVENSELNHYATIQMWENAFPEAEFNVRIFETNFLQKGNTVADFLHIIGLEEIYAEGSDSEINISLSGGALKFLVDYNNFAQAHENYSSISLKNISVRRKLLSFVRRNFRGPKLSPPIEIQQEIQNLFAESNEAVRSTFFPDRSDLFEPSKIDEDPGEMEVNEVERLSLFFEVFNRFLQIELSG